MLEYMQFTLLYSFKVFPNIHLYNLSAYHMLSLYYLLNRQRASCQSYTVIIGVLVVHMQHSKIITSQVGSSSHRSSDN